ncbi:MAG: microviridin/marinostatin family tricyclic proteinase inhibitor [Heteroscytonema crispum UTEX LB 1556]
MSDNNEKALPFFARYLEEQFCEDLSEEEMDAVQGGLRFAAPPTRKHPPESPDGIATTLKYPSDQEDGGGGNPITNKLKDEYAVTKKYPSDGDDIAVTQKYPSDGDDDILAID